MGGMDQPAASARLVHDVRAVGLGRATSYQGGALTVAGADAQACFADPSLASVSFSWSSPGDPTRIVKVLDAVEPRTAGTGGAGVFPGFLGPAAAHPPRTVHVLRGAAVVVAGFLPRAQEAVVDMSGPAAALSPLGATHNLVVEFEPAPAAPWEDVDVALRRGSLALAVLLADAALGAPPDAEECFAPAPDPDLAGSDLPAVAGLTNLQTQGAFKDVFVGGTSFSGSTPALLDPAALDAGMIVSGQFGHPSLKNPTIVHQNSPVVAALRARHGVDLRFAGLVISPEPVDAAGKERVSAQAAELCAAAGFDAVIVTKEGGGNADGDMALKMDALEDLGIAAVGLFAEMAGPDGTGPPIVVPPERATAMVSTGNYDHRLALPAMERALGGAELALLSVPATEAMELPVAVLYASLSPLGWGRLTCAGDAGAVTSNGEDVG